MLQDGHDVGQRVCELLLHGLFLGRGGPLRAVRIDLCMEARAGFLRLALLAARNHRREPNQHHHGCTRHNRDLASRAAHGTRVTSPLTRHFRGEFADMAGAADARASERMLWLVSLLFFLASWSPTGMLRTGSLYLLDRSMSVSQIGAIEAATLFAPAVTNPLWGLLADVTLRRKAVSAATSIASLALLGVLAVPAVGCARCFWPIGSVMTALAACNLGGAVDAYALDFLGHARQAEYGKYRLWGSVGWGLSAVVVGLVTQHCGFGYNFPIYFAAGAIQLLLFTACLPRRTQSERARSSGRRGGPKPASPLADDDAAPGGGSLRAALSRARVLLVFTETLLLGVGVGIAEKLIFAYVVNELRAPPSLCGYGVACMSASNIPLFFFSSALLRTVGRDAMFCAAVGAYALRTLAYTWLTPATVYWFLPIELLHGVTFSLSRAATVDFTTTALPPGWLTTGQQVLVNLGPQGLGGGLGALLGGAHMAAYGGIATYTLAARAGAAMLCFHVACCAVLGLCGRPTPMGQARAAWKSTEPLLADCHSAAPAPSPTAAAEAAPPSVRDESPREHPSPTAESE